MDILQHLPTLFMLVLLQAILGIDNLLYISIESKKVELSQQKRVRQYGILLAMVLRIALLFIVVRSLPLLKEEVLSFGNPALIDGHFSIHALTVLLGGGFILYTATKEIWHIITFDGEDEHHGKSKQSFNRTLALIVAMNLVFSVDSILTAISLTEVLWVMIVAIVIGGLIMILLADQVSDFLKKNRVYEVLGLFILFIVGIMLLSEGAHLSHMHLAGEPIHAMPKSTFYFVVIVLIGIDIIQTRYQRNLSKSKK